MEETRYFSNSWTFHSFDDGLKHSFEKVQQILNRIGVHRSLLHFTHSSSMPSFLRNYELMLFDRDFSTYSVLKAFSAKTLFENSRDSNLLVYYKQL